MDQVTFERGVVGVLPVLLNAEKETERPASMVAAAACASSVTSMMFRLTLLDWEAPQALDKTWQTFGVAVIT